MGLVATFVGVNRYLDPKTRDLTGAVRDATALWALFSDGMPEISAELLIDEKATCSTIRKRLSETLQQANEDDTVIFTFSGHGSRDHRIIAHDTSRESLSTSSIPMREIAEMFKASKAKAILCILDCCFSGGAPAKVLEDTPQARDPDENLDMLSGNGRILLAAANIDEPAYETPGTGHGLLTRALIQAIRRMDRATPLSDLITAVMETVRADAERLGVIQTPVSLGYIEGGLNLPVLKAGEKYYASFPEEKGIRVSQDLSDLKKFGIPEPIIAEWKERFANGLNVLQLAAINEHRILDGESVLVVAPTSSGKTFVGELAAVRSVLQGRKAIFLFPYRALVNEKYQQFVASYGDRMGVRVIRCNGDYSDQAGLFINGKYDLAVLTYEMFLSLVVSNPFVLNQMGIVVVDEAQFIIEPSRGIVVELLLTFLLTARERGIQPQLVALSAVIGNANSFDQWLGLRYHFTSERPVPLVEGVLDRSGRFIFIDENGRRNEQQLLAPGAVQMRKDKPGSQDIIVPLVKQLVANGEKVIVFRNRRGSAEGCAKYLASELSLPPAEDVIAVLPTRDLSSSSSALRTCFVGRDCLSYF